MNRRVAVFVAAGAALGVGTGVGLNQLGTGTRPHSIGQPAAAFGQQTPALVGAVPYCVDIPAKVWGGTWHYSLAIRFPTRLEHYCVEYPAAGGTLVRVTVSAVTP